MQPAVINRFISAPSEVIVYAPSGGTPRQDIRANADPINRILTVHPGPRQFSRDFGPLGGPCAELTKISVRYREVNHLRAVS
jgi:hypothetical protein